MNTKLLMTASSFFLGVLGLSATFAPAEMATWFGLHGNIIIIFQLMGALYLGFAFLNWNAKAVLIGGIYSKPVALGNLVHFMSGALALLKWAVNPGTNLFLWIITGLYILFALLFAIVTFYPPRLQGIAG